MEGASVIQSMKCIHKNHEYRQEQYLGYELHVTDSEGNEGKLFEDFEELRLIVKNGKYRITNDKGEVFRQGLCDGTPESIFEAYDSTSSDVPIFNLLLETPDYSGSFEDFELVHGHNRVEREKRRKFYLYTETMEGATSFGITETKGKYTKAIHSVYIPEEMSRREKARFIVKYLYDLLAANQFASLSYSGLTFDNVNIHEYGFESFKRYLMAKDSDRLEEAHLLYNDAIERKETVIETFDKGVKYEVQGLFKEEESEAEPKEGEKVVNE